MRRTPRLALPWLLICSAGLYAGDSKTHTTEPDERLFEQAGLASSDEVLRAYLAGRSTPMDAKAIAGLVERLGGKDFKDRQAASITLFAMGPNALPHLCKHLKHPDVEVVWRLQECVERLERTRHNGLPEAAVRLLIKRRTVGAVEILLRYLPAVTDQELEEEIYFGLEQLALRDRDIDPQLERALTDTEAARRAVAACLLGRAGDAKQRGKVRKLLRDESGLVRLRAAQGLLAAKDASGLEALVGVLGKEPVALAWQAEELLRWVAADAAPVELVGNGKDRAACQAAWQKWLERTGDKVDWTKREESPSRPGLVLVDAGLSSSPHRAYPSLRRLRLYGCDGRARHVLETPNSLGSWALLPNGHLILAEAEGVVERDVQGKTVWKRAWSGQCGMVDLVNQGQIFVSTDTETAVLDLAGAQVRGQKQRRLHWSRHDPWLTEHGTFWTVEKGQLSEFDPRQEEAIRQFPLPEEHSSAQIVTGTVLTDQQFLVVIGPYSLKRGAWHELRRIDHSGKTLGSVLRPGEKGAPLSGIRNGNVLAGYRIEEGHGDEGHRVEEIDPSGRLVWQATGTGRLVGGMAAFPLVRFGFSGSGWKRSSIDTVAYWLDRLERGSVTDQRHALGRLAKSRLSREEAHRVLKCLPGSDLDVSVLLLDLMVEGHYPVPASEIPALLRILGDDRTGNQSARLLRTAGESAIDPTTQVVEDRKLPVKKRAWAAWSLAGFLDDQRAAQTLRRAIRDPEHEVRYMALHGLCGRGEVAKPWFPELLELTRGEDRAVANDVLLLLGNLGLAAEPVVPRLLEALEDKDLRRAAARALFVLALRPDGPARKEPKVLATLITHLQRKAEPAWIEMICNVLHPFGSEAKDAIPVLIKLLADNRRHSPGNDSVREVAARILARIGPEARAAVPALTAIIKDSKAEVTTQRQAIWALKGIGPEAEEAVPALFAIVEQATRENFNLGGDAVEAIKIIAPKRSDEAVKTYKERTEPKSFLPPVLSGQD